MAYRSANISGINKISYINWGDMNSIAADSYSIITTDYITA